MVGGVHLGCGTSVPNLEGLGGQSPGDRDCQPKRGMGQVPRVMAGLICQFQNGHYRAVEYLEALVSCVRGSLRAFFQGLGHNHSGPQSMPGRGPAVPHIRKEVRWGFSGQLSQAFCPNDINLVRKFVRIGWRWAAIRSVLVSLVSQDVCRGLRDHAPGPLSFAEVHHTIKLSGGRVEGGGMVKCQPRHLWSGGTLIGWPQGRHAGFSHSEGFAQL